MMKKRNLRIVLFLLAFALLSSFISAEYIRSGTQYISPGAGSGFFSGSAPIDRSACEAGQDFIVQVSPLGCSPTVVRSDLLEEQNAAVLCPLAATKINPLIDVESIKDIDFRLENGSNYITGISFQHAKAALGLKEQLNSPVLNNIGYAVIVLKEQKNASLMPDYVEGKLVATIRYDIENAFGIGTTTFNLPDIADSDWDDEKAKYSFWNGKFYIKAEGIDEEGAQISIYDDVKRISSVNIDKGKKSDTIYLPGFDCYAGLQLSLVGLSVPEARARIDVNGEVYEAAVKEKFFENRCTVKDLRRYGVYESVSLSCNGDDKRSEAFTLIISPKIKLSIAGETKEYGAGERLFEYQDNGKLKVVYLGYVGSLNDSKKESDLYTILVESTQSKEKLSDDELSKISRLAKSYEAKKMAVSITDHVSSESKSIVGILTGGLEWIITGTNYHYISYKNSEEIGEKDKKKVVILEGFVDPVDGDLLEAIKNYYGDANVDYDKILDSYLNEKIDDKTEFGEAALYNKAKLAADLNQSRTAMDLCEEFKEKYPNSNKNLVFCNAYKLANSYLSSRHIVVNGRLRQISLENIYEPTPDDYSAKMLINGERYVFTKDEIKYLEGGVVSGLDINSFKSAVTKAFGANSACLQYADEVLEAANKHGIDDSLRLMALMKQESECNADADSGLAKGLMQIKDWQLCTSLGISGLSDLEGKNNAGKNIECGALILKKNYESYGPKTTTYSCSEYTFTIDPNYKDKTEPAINAEYTGWDAALRAYNGWGCAGLKADKKSEILADHNFVEDVNKIYNSLKTSAGTYATTTTGTKSVQLMGLGEDYAEVKISGVSGTKTVRKGIVEDFGSGYAFNLVDIKLKKLAKVTINPKVENAGSKAIVPFKIGIEKRSIQLSPEQTSDLIKKTNERIAKWDSLTNKLGGVVKDFKTACLATGTALTLKNLIGNLGGKALARTAVMRSKGGWVDKCRDLVNNGTYKKDDDCFADKTSEIERDVDNYYNNKNQQNNEIKQLEASGTCQKTGFLGSRTIDDDCFLKDYLIAAKPGIETCLTKRYPNGVDNQGNKIEVDKFILSLNENTTTIEELRELQLNCRLEGGLLGGMSDEALKKSVIDININTDLLKKIAEDNVKYGEIKSDLVMSKNTRTIEFSEDYAVKDLAGVMDISSLVVLGEEDISENDHVRIVRDIDSAGKYLVVLDKDNHVDRTYKINDDDSLTKTSDKNPLEIDFKKVTAKDYNNFYKNPQVRYFETEPYKGMPALVPFDKKNGWYAVVKQTLPVLGGIRAYDESGRANSFYICNVGENGVEENMKSPDDSCIQINALTNQPYNKISGLSEDAAAVLAEKAKEAISQARTNQGQSKVSILGEVYEVGEPMTDIPSITCEEIMPVSDCKILYNVCDPVVCPSSRCDLGGTYPVKDVVQSGFAGSLLLCSKNFIGAGGDVFVPVCLSGIHASMDGWNQIQKAYRDCLQESLNTGKMTGICDEIYSIHKCEFFWRQGLPLAKYLVPKAIETIAGQNVKGGGEYLDVRSAFNNADKSVKYFTQYYADNSYAAFKARSAEQIGTQACKAYVSASFPNFDSLVDTLTEPDSPMQAHGRFDEIPYTTATNPPISQYKVWYFIYAGKDRGGYYQVYLKEGAESSYYQDTSYNRIVASGYLKAGERIDETPDFTAPSGYKQLCIRVNEQEICGFKQVTTDFGVSYVKDLYMAQQANQTNIQGTKECVAGTPSLYSVLSPNPEGAVDEIINPSIYNRGIIRICATENPGKTSDSYYGTDKQRWREVGECDDNLKCWLDSDSVKNVIYATNIEKSVLNNTIENQLEILKRENGFLSNEEFANLIDNLTKSSDPNKKIKLVDENLPKTFLSNEKAKLHLIRGDAYGELARLGFISIPKPVEDDSDIFDDDTLTSTPGTPVTTPSGVDDEDLTQLLSPEIAEQAKGKNPIEFQDGTGTSNPIFTFEDDKWKWKSDPDEDWKDTDVLAKPIGELYYIEQENLNQFKSYNFPILVFRLNTQKGIWEWGATNDLNPPSYASIAWGDIHNYDVDSNLRNPQSLKQMSILFKDVTEKAIFFKRIQVANKDQVANILIGEGAKTYSITQSVQIAGVSPEFIEKNKNFISNLNGKTYEDGLNALVNKTRKNDGGSLPCWLGGCTKLKSGSVEMDHDGVFTFNQKYDDNQLRLKFDSTWLWSTDGNNYASIVSIPDSVKLNSNDQQKVDSLQTKIDSLNKNNADDEQIFDLKTQKENIIYKEIEARLFIQNNLKYPNMDWGTYLNISKQGNVASLQDKDLKKGVVIVFDEKKVDVYDFKKRSEEELIKIANKAVEKGVLNKECLRYTHLIYGVSKDPIPDPLLLMALIQSESSCDATADSGTSLGLMQVNKNNNGTFGLPASREETAKRLLSSLSVNVRIGTDILIWNYKRYSNDKTYQRLVTKYCNNAKMRKIYLSYEDHWQRALRAYNTLKCDKTADLQYVEKVMANYNQLAKIADGKL